MVIPREAGRITYSTEVKNLKKRLRFSGIQRAVLIGSVFGDGHLEISKSCINYRLRLAQSVKQKDYLFWKYFLLKDFVSSKPRFHNATKSVLFSTISHPEISELAGIFYRGKIKILPKNISEFISNPMILAVWFMDDGNAIVRNGKTYGYHLNTQSFTKDENEDISYVLRKIYGIESLLEKNHGKYRLRIMKKLSRDKFREVVEDHILDSMKYKLG
jgi:hypothetical protein